MRDTFADSEYFEKKIISLREGIERFFTWIETGKTPKERINIVKRAIVWDYISLVNSKYSNGADPNELKEDLLNAINVAFQSWDGFWKLKDAKGVEYDQYTLSAYDEMLWMLSLAYLLDISDDDFKKLVTIIDRDNIKDLLFEFIIKKRIINRQSISEESYTGSFAIPDIFGNIRKAIQQTDKIQAEHFLKNFIENDWYKKHAGAGWHNSHKSNQNSYSGYWSYETAAVIKIMDLDHEKFENYKHYPKDLL